MLNWYRRWERSQALVILPVVLVLTGTAGLILGSAAARSFGNLGGPLAVRGAATTMLLGGLATLCGIRWNWALTAVSGMAIGALGSALYGVGTLIGFGTGGIMSGLGWLGISAVLLERVMFSLVRARSRHQIEDVP